jgi:hypothetical protein
LIFSSSLKWGTGSAVIKKPSTTCDLFRRDYEMEGSLA